MADLMSGSCTYTLLENKYGNFMVPAVKIKASGTDLVAKLELTVDEITVTLSLSAASAVQIKLADLYDAKTHTFESSVKSKFKLGTVIEVELGYLSATVPVFKGYVSGIGAEFDQGEALLVIQLMDARRLMMTGGSKYMIHDVKNYSDAFGTVIGDYAKLCSKEIEATSDNLTNPVTQTTDDYNFITGELIKKGKAEREFFILADKAYFRTPAKNKTPIMTVTYGRELLSLSVMSGYIDLSVEVSGYDPLKQETVSAKAPAKTKSPMTAVLSKSPEVQYIDPDSDTEQKAKVRAGMIAKRELENVCTAEGKLIGIPEIVPGRYLAVKDLEELVDKKYYLTEVTHKISNAEFSTSFEAGGWI